MGNRTFVDKMRERIKMHPNKKISEEILEKFEERVDGNNKIFCTFYNSFGIAEDTIVTCEYNGNGKLYVPANVCGHRINRIGYYALFYGADIKTI